MVTTSKESHSALVEGGSFCLCKIRNHPYKTFDEQLDEIRKKGILIDNEDIANEAIRSFSYYSIINGYKDLFLDTSKTAVSQERCLPGTTFSMLYTVHWMDIILSGILFKYTLVVEKKLKTQVSNLVGNSYTIEEDQYLNKRNYSQAKHHRGKLKELISKIDESKNKDISAKHYFEAEKNLPPWIAAKAISFGNTIIWYSILKDTDKHKIIFELLPECRILKTQDSFDFFDSIIDQVYQYRNLTAHGNRTFSLNLPKPVRLKFLKSIQKDKFFKCGENYHRNDLHSLIIVLALLINDPFVLNSMIIELTSFFEQYSQPEFIFVKKNIYQLFNLPKDIIDRLNNLYEIKFPS